MPALDLICDWCLLKPTTAPTTVALLSLHQMWRISGRGEASCGHSWVRSLVWPEAKHASSTPLARCLFSVITFCPSLVSAALVSPLVSGVMICWSVRGQRSYWRLSTARSSITDVSTRIALLCLDANVSLSVADFASPISGWPSHFAATESLKAMAG